MALVASACLVAAGTASADTPFGGNPAGAVTPGVTCENSGAPYFLGAPTCTWWWSHAGVGSDFAPLPVTGGTATITSVTLPAMPNPGTMQVVILTAALSATNEPSKPQFICCQVKTLGPTFTVPANQVTTVPQSLAVFASKEANLEHPGETSFGDIAAISVLTPGASLPLRYTGQTAINSPSAFEVDEVYFPAPTATSGEFHQGVDPAGFEVMAQYSLGGTPVAPTPAPAPAPTPGPAAKTGVKLGGKAFHPGADGKTLGLGKATNPPTAATTQTLTLPPGDRPRLGRRRQAEEAGGARQRQDDGPGRQVGAAEADPQLEGPRQARQRSRTEGDPDHRRHQRPGRIADGDPERHGEAGEAEEEFVGRRGRVRPLRLGTARPGVSEATRAGCGRLRNARDGVVCGRAGAGGWHVSGEDA